MAWSFAIEIIVPYLSIAVSMVPGIKHNKMESKIRVAVDFENGNSPFIEVVKAKSEDVRDHLVGAFLEMFPSHNRWAKVVYTGQEQENGPLHYKITPIKEEEIRDEMRLMSAYMADKTKEPQMVNIHDNSHGFRQFLDDKGIKWKPNEHYTLVDASVDLFTLGRLVQEDKANSKPA